MATTVNFKPSIITDFQPIINDFKPIETDWTGEVGYKGKTIASSIAAKDWESSTGYTAKGLQLKQQLQGSPEIPSVSWGSPETVKKIKETDFLDYLTRSTREFFEMNEAEWSKHIDREDVLAIPAAILTAVSKIGKTFTPETGKDVQEIAWTTGIMSPAFKAGEQTGKYVYNRAKDSIPAIFDKIKGLISKKSTQEITEEIPNIVKKEIFGRVRKEDAKIIERRLKKSTDFTEGLDTHLNKNMGRRSTDKVDKIASSWDSSAELTKYAGSINLNRQNISQAAKQMEIEIFQREGITKVVNNKKTINEANKIFKQLQDDSVYFEEKIAAIKAGKTPTIPEELAFRTLNAKNQMDFMDAVQKLNKGKISPEDFKLIENKIKDIQLNIVDPLASEAGRRLQSYNIEVGKNRAFRAIAKLKKSMNERQIKELSELDFDNPIKVIEFVKRLPDPKFREYFYEYWYNAILSGIPTHVINVATNTIWLVAQLPHRALVGGVDKVISAFTGKERDYFVKEVIPMFAGIKSGAKKGAEGALEVMKTGKSSNWNSKYGVEMGHDIMSAFERSPYEALKKIAPAISAPTRGLQMMDIQFKGIAFDMYTQALAKRASLKQGLKGETAKQFEIKFLKKMPKEAIDEATKFDDYSTFQDAPGKITEQIEKMRDAVPVGRLIVPFIQTISNITKRGIEMTPVVGLSLARGQKPAEIIAKQIEGAIITYIIADKLEAGEITGGYPKNPAEKDAWIRQGKLPWSIRIGDKWIQYRRIEPFNTVISTVESFHKNFIKNPEDKTIPEKFLNATKGVVDNLIDSSMMDGIRNILDKDKWEGMGQRQIVSLIPYSGLLRSTSRAFEAIVEDEVLLRDTKDFRGAVSQTLPGLYGEQNPRLDVWGEEIKIEGNFFRQWLPYKWAKATDDPLEKELERLKIYPGLPGKSGEIGDVKYKLNDDEYKNYVKMSGKHGRMLIQEIINSSNYKELADKNKIKLIDRVYTKTKLTALRYAKTQKKMTPEFEIEFMKNLD